MQCGRYRTRYRTILRKISYVRFTAIVRLDIVHIPYRYSTDIVPILRYPHLKSDFDNAARSWSIFQNHEITKNWRRTIYEVDQMKIANKCDSFFAAIRWLSEQSQRARAPPRSTPAALPLPRNPSPPPCRRTPGRALGPEGRGRIRWRT